MTDGLLNYLDVFIICASPIDMRPTLDLHRELVLIERAIRQSSIPIRLKRISPPTSSQLKHMFSADFGIAVDFLLEMLANRSPMPWALFFFDKLIYLLLGNF